MGGEDWAEIARKADASMQRQGRFFDAGLCANLANEIERLKRERDEARRVLRMVGAYLPDPEYTADACLILGPTLVRMIRESGGEEE